MSNDQKPEVREVIQPARVAPVVDMNSAAFQAAVNAAVKAALAQMPAAAPVSSEGGLNQKLIEVLLAKEAREANEAHEKALVLAHKQVQAGKNAQSTEQEKREKQRRCKHIKGGRLQKKGIKDWNLSCHTFPDGSEVIKCQGCGMKWKERDTKEFLYRGEQVRTANGIQSVIRKYRNHTGIGWNEARLMLEDSTNTPTCSEVVMTRSKPDQPAANSGALQQQQTTEVDNYGTPVEETVQQ